MAGSYRQIPYNIRPAKAIERKMLCEALSRLTAFSDLAEYRYVGFGATFFTDFALIHKMLGLHDLVSIESEISDRERFEFNCPYRCVKLNFGHSNDVLPKISWTKKTILWIDYDESLNEEMLTDVGTFIANAKPGSVILITIDVKPDSLPERKKDKTRLHKFIKRVGRAKVPVGVAEKDLDQANLPRVCHKIVNNEIEEVLLRRNGGLIKRLEYRQLFNFYYKDSCPMLSFGGILYEAGDERIENCYFEKIKFLRCDRNIYNPFEIKVPNLTLREMRHLDRMLPSLRGVSPPGRKYDFLAKHIEAYGQIYRYIPNFVDAQIN